MSLTPVPVGVRLRPILEADLPQLAEWAGTDIDNLPEQRSLEKAGFTRKGVLRGAQWRAGQWRDEVLYSRLRGE